MAIFTVMDPITRIEGHMKVEVKIEDNYVVDAHCTGTLFRGIEALRVIHSFDPCLSCAVHIMRPKGKSFVINTDTI